VKRNQRLAAGAVGVVVALATGIILVPSLTSDPIPANPPPSSPGRRRWRRAPSRTLLTATSTSPIPDGSNTVKIADAVPDEGCDGISEYSSPSWSPDGRYLAFQRNCSSPDQTDVLIADPHGDVVAEFPSEGWQTPWSPDSTRVAVWDTWPQTIGVYGLDGARQTQLTMPSGWTPSGDHDPV
jgi:hypothetical protein